MYIWNGCTSYDISCNANICMYLISLILQLLFFSVCDYSALWENFELADYTLMEGHKGEGWHFMYKILAVLSQLDLIIHVVCFRLGVWWLGSRVLHRPFQKQIET